MIQGDENLIARGRPCDVIEGLNCLIQRPTDYSFPSGHTGSSFAGGVVLFLGLPKKYSFLFLVLTGLIGMVILLQFAGDKKHMKEG